MLRYSELNSHQKEFVCNGCGGKGGIVNPPEFLFNASCNHHDFLYWRGCSEADRKKADDEFYEMMKEDILNLLEKETEEAKSTMNDFVKLKWYSPYRLTYPVFIADLKIKEAHYRLWAYTYYKSVRLIGKKFFHYGDRMKNMVDLVKEMRGSDAKRNR